MEYRLLGKTELKVSALGLGTWPIGGSIQLGGAPTGYGTVPQTEAVRAVNRALDLGITFFDSSDSYGLGRSERILAEAASRRRGQMVLATKAGWVADGTERWMKDVSPDHLRAAAERCRRRLGVDEIDVFQLHALPDEGDETERALDALDELKTTGTIRTCGASVGWDLDTGLRLLRTGRLDTIQVHYNLLHQGAATDLLDEALRRQVGVIVSSPLAYGFLSGRYTRNTTFSPDDWRSRLTPEEITARLERVAELRFLTAEGTRSLRDAALAFVLAHPAVSSAIPGFRSQEQVDGLAESLEAPPLNDIELARAREIARSRTRSA
jgi:aryl-alcohol dehydrogenase-like predicted oxidoreductase